MDTNVYHASKKRLLLSWYIDFLFFLTLWDLLSYFLSLDENAPFWVPYLLFVVIRMISGKYIGSIGYLFLGIDKETKAVNPDIFERENWLTILLGVLLILEGTKQLVRWTQMFVPQPIFGVLADDITQIIIHVVSGISSILAAYWFLKLNIKGLYLAVSLAVINIISDALSWNLWDPVVEKMVITRRELQGMPIRDGEVEFMQALFPEGVILVASFAVIAMLFTYRRFNNA
ncbi:MAG: hypothetical protein ACXWAT_07280 [Methylobacter sp.]